MHARYSRLRFEEQPVVLEKEMRPINFMQRLPGRSPSFAQPRHLQLLQDLRAHWGKRHLLCGLLGIAFVFGASALSQNRQLESLIHEGQGALDSGESAVAVSNFERATQMAPDNLEANRGLLLSYLQAQR